MDKINGINLNNLNSINKGTETDTKTEETIEKDLFEIEDTKEEDLTEKNIDKITDGFFLENKLDYGNNISPENMEKYKEQYKKLYNDAKNFDVEEAHVYVEGEAAIEKEVEKRIKQQMLLHDIRGGKSREEIEAEVRAEYEKEHPEYAAVKKEGQRVEQEFNKAKSEAMADWIKDNPLPEPPNPITGGISDSAKYTRELKKWQEKYDAEVAKFEEQYAKENPNYANLKEQQEAQEKKNKNPLLTGGLFGGIGSIIQKKL